MRNPAAKGMNHEVILLVIQVLPGAHARRSRYPGAGADRVASGFLDAFRLSSAAVIQKLMGDGIKFLTCLPTGRWCPYVEHVVLCFPRVLVGAVPDMLALDEWKRCVVMALAASHQEFRIVSRDEGRPVYAGGCDPGADQYALLPGLCHPHAKCSGYGTRRSFGSTNQPRGGNNGLS